jgi:hypothetical protein
MPDSHATPSFVKRTVWLGLGVGCLAQLGLKTILPIAILVAIRFFSLETDRSSLWLEDPSDSSHPVWYVLQAAVFVGSVLAGSIAALLSPRKSIFVPVALVFLSLLATGFEQFPRPMSPVVTLVWAAGPCAGLLLGWLLVRMLARREA